MATKKGDEGLPFTPKNKRLPGMGDEGKPLKPGLKGKGDEGMTLVPKVKKKKMKKTARGK